MTFTGECDMIHVTDVEQDTEGIITLTIKIIPDGNGDANTYLNMKGLKRHAFLVADRPVETVVLRTNDTLVYTLAVPIENVNSNLMKDFSRKYNKDGSKRKVNKDDPQTS